MSVLKHPITMLCIIGALALGFVFMQWQQTYTMQTTLNTLVQATEDWTQEHRIILSKRARKPAKRIAKGVYLTAYSANTPATVSRIIELINQTELNAVVVDIKDYSGKVLYDSDVPLVNELRLEEHRIKNIAGMIEQFHEHDIYVIARQTVFQDPILAERQPAWAIRQKGGGVWRDRKGLAWVDPTNLAIWEYNIAVAKEAVSLGFDEINFDYVRFPSDGNMSEVVYTTGDRERHDVMREFYEYVSDELSNEPAWLSLDFFGFVMERHDGLSIGQRLEDAVDVVDYISPMMYPSHYPIGHLGLANPAAQPGMVIENGMKKGTPYFEDKRAQLRPWLQAFHLGAQYNAAEIHAQIDMVEQYPNAGWLLWNASNRYTDAGLKSEEIGNGKIEI